MTTFSELGLSAEIVRAVSEKGYTNPSPVQCKAIPTIIKGRDVFAGAQTGTGKTAGFTLPMLHRLSEQKIDPKKRIIRALILTPTRELAAQVDESVKQYAKFVDIKSTAVFGGVKINGQINKLRQGIDILVATPGRLLDHIGQRTVDLSRVQFLVFDEADRMLDMGFIGDIRKILPLLPKNGQGGRQTLLFSATYSNDIQKLASSLLHNPEQIEIASRNSTVKTVSQLIHPVDKERKAELLSWLIGSKNWKQVLVFTRTKHGANRLASHLISNGLSAAAIHSNKSQGARTKALKDFKSGAVRVLVATDIAARGLDISQLPHVVNYELPNVAEDYVHRIGRTGRAGNSGQAISLVCKDEMDYLRNIERLINKSLQSVTVENFEPSHKSSTPAVARIRDSNNKPSRNRGGNQSSDAKRVKAKKKHADKSKQAKNGSAARGQNNNNNVNGKTKPNRNPKANGKAKRAVA